MQKSLIQYHWNPDHVTNSETMGALRRSQVVLNHLVAYLFGLSASELKSLHEYVRSWSARREVGGDDADDDANNDDNGEAAAGGGGPGGATKRAGKQPVGARKQQKK